MKKVLIVLVTVLAMVAMACSNGDEETTADEAAATDEASDEAAGAGDEASPGTSTLQAVLDRGALQCGVGSVPGFSAVDADGVDVGFDVDICRAVAAAVLGDAGAVEFQTGVPGSDRLTLLVAENFDLLSRTTTNKMSRDLTDNVEFLPTVYYDGQLLMGKKSGGITGASGFDVLEGGTVCVASGSTTEVNIEDASATFGVDFEVVTREERDDLVEIFASGACDFFTTDASALAGYKFNNDTEDDWVIFGPELSKEPLAPVVRAADSQWFDLVKWTIYALFLFDERGITAANADDMAANPPDVEIANLLGVGDGELQSGLGLAPDAFLTMVKSVGNYAEIFDRHLNPMGLFREGSLNAQWTDGGLIYAPVAK